MYKWIRVMIAIFLVLGIVLLARDQIAWAGPAAGEADPSQAKDVSPAPLQAGDADRDGPGSVKPPRPSINVCENGLYSVGGLATININSLAPGYCLEAYLHNKNFALGRIPDSAGKILANVTFLQVFYHGKFTYEVPPEDGDIEICFALLPNTQAQIYFYDHYGSRFGKHTGQPAWEPLQTTIENGMACAPAQTSGAYALIGQ